MATSTQTFTNPNWAVQATFNAIAGGYIDANLQAFGWVYVAQSGDIDPNTAAPVLDATTGFRVYRTNDGLTNIYMRIDYGNRAYGGSGAASLKFTFGTGANGSGTITGVLMSGRTVQTDYQGGTYRSYMSGDSGRFMIIVNCGSASTSLAASYAMGFAFGRWVDNSGNPSADGAEFFHTTGGAGAQNAVSHISMPLAGTLPTVETGGWVAAMPHSSQVINSKMMIGFPQSWDENGLKNPSIHVAIHDASSLTPGNTYVASRYGGSHTYLIGGHSGMYNNSSYRPLWLYE